MMVRSKRLPQTLATADPPAHTVHKKLVFPELVAKRMAAMTADVEQVAGTCIDELLREHGGDFMAMVANPVPICAAYWHMVDFLWVINFALLYVTR